MWGLDDPPGAWVLAVDFGATNTVAAIGDATGVHTLAINGKLSMPSAVLLMNDEEGVRWLVGDYAINEALAPRGPIERFERSPRSCIGSKSVYFGDRPVLVTVAIAAVLRVIVEKAAQQQRQRPPETFVVTHPATWPAHWIDVLRDAARLAAAHQRNWPDPAALPEPLAAAYCTLKMEEVPLRARIVVLDIGAGTVDVTVVDRSGSQLSVVGRPLGMEGVGGWGFDLRLAQWMTEEVAPGLFERLVTSDVAADLVCAYGIRNTARTVKEELSHLTVVPARMPASPPDLVEDTPVMVSRAILEELIKGGPGNEPGLIEAVALVSDALHDAPAGPPFAGAYLVGGSSRIPLLGRLVQQETGRPPISRGDPATAAANGAAAYAFNAVAARLSERPSNGIFISYRRSDDPGFAGRLYDRLVGEFPVEQVFMDVDSIELGLDFVEELERTLSHCNVLIVVIGQRWLSATDGSGERRLFHPNDYVRLEIETALSRRIRVIPILVEAATMPRPDELPETIKSLTRHQKQCMSHAQFGSDMLKLISTLKRIIQK